MIAVAAMPVVVIAFEFEVFGGSMGVAAGERIARAFEHVVGNVGDARLRDEPGEMFGDHESSAMRAWADARVSSDCRPCYQQHSGCAARGKGGLTRARERQWIE